MNSEDLKSLEGCVSLAQYLREETLNLSPSHKVEAVIFIRRIPVTEGTEVENPFTQCIPNKGGPLVKKMEAAAKAVFPSILEIVWVLVTSMSATFGMDYLSLDEGFTRMHRDWAFLAGIFLLGAAVYSTYSVGVLNPSVLIALYGIFTFFPTGLSRRELFPYSSDIFNYILVDHFVWFHVKHLSLGIVTLFTYLNFHMKTALKKPLKKE